MICQKNAAGNKLSYLCICPARELTPINREKALSLGLGTKLDNPMQLQ